LIFGSASVATPAHHRIVTSYSSPLLLGPPPSGDLLALMTPDLSTRNGWHWEFAEIFERVYSSGHLADYVRSARASLRVLPVHQISGALHGAWPADRLEEVLEPYHRFALGNCQCRMAMQLVGRGCDRPLENCVAFGPLSKPVVEARTAWPQRSVKGNFMINAAAEAGKRSEATSGRTQPLSPTRCSSAGAETRTFSTRPEASTRNPTMTSPRSTR
jgi:hypothetical protein